MRPVSLFLAATLAASVTALAGSHRAAGDVGPGRVGQSVTDCIRAWPEVRYGALGYNHIVHIANACTPTADCSVTTNVNPQPIAVAVPGHGKVEVTTWLGSPAREFTPNVRCTMRR